MCPLTSEKPVQFMATRSQLTTADWASPQLLKVQLKFKAPEHIKMSFFSKEGGRKEKKGEEASKIHKIKYVYTVHYICTPESSL